MTTINYMSLVQTEDMHWYVQYKDMNIPPPADRLELIQFYESELGQAIYPLRSKSIEPLIEHIKSVFRIDPLQVRGYQKASGMVLLSVLLHQILVYYNYKTRHSQRPKAIKHMLCC